MSFPQLPFCALRTRKIGRASSSLDIQLLSANSLLAGAKQAVATSPLLLLGGNTSVNRQGGSSWTPANTTTELWLDSSDSGTIIARPDTTIFQWGDKSGNGRDLKQPFAPASPQLVTNAQNGLNGIFFDANTRILRTDNFDFPVLSSYSVYAVVSGGSLAANQSRGIIMIDDGSFDITTNYTFERTSRTNEDFTVYITNTKLAGVGLSASGFTAKTLHHERTINVSSTLRIDGTQVASTNTGNHVTQNYPIDSRITLGVSVSNGTGYYLGNMYEIIICAPIERLRIEGYLAHKWGITANLPVDHPYKTTPPTA